MNIGTGKAATSFEELHTYQRARELANAVYEITRGREFTRDRGLVDQIRRASVSVMSNIAEGFERGTKTEFIQFLYFAKGSCGEIRAQLQIACDQKYISVETHASIASLAKRVSGMIANLVDHLKTSTYQGPKASPARRQSASNLHAGSAISQT